MRGSSFRGFVETSGTPGTAGSIQSGLAISNPSDFSITVDCELLDMKGISTGWYAYLTIPGEGQIARFLPEIFTGAKLPENFQGIIRIESVSSEIAIVGLRSHINERGEFLITTTTPVDDTLTAGGTKMSFPYLVNGAGYSTQFFMYGGFDVEQVVGGNLQFFRQDGTLLHLPF